MQSSCKSCIQILMIKSSYNSTVYIHQTMSSNEHVIETYPKYNALFVWCFTMKLWTTILYCRGMMTCNQQGHRAWPPVPILSDLELTIECCQCNAATSKLAETMQCSCTLAQSSYCIRNLQATINDDTLQQHSGNSLPCYVNRRV